MFRRCFLVSLTVLALVAGQPFGMLSGDSGLAVFSAVAAEPRCSVCGKRISGRYIKDNSGRMFCSKACYERTLPKCAVCGRPAKFSSGGEHFCSEKCQQSKWPRCSHCGKRSNGGVKRGTGRKFLCSECAALPRCFSCGMPGDFGRFADGRHICKACNRTSVNDLAAARDIAEEVRALMREKLGLGTDNPIEYSLVPQDELKGKTTHEAQGIELGLYRFEQMVESTTTTTTFLGKTESRTDEEVKGESHKIYFLFGIPENRFREVAAHELAHDWMQKFYPQIDDLKVKEGWAEFVASRVNILYGRPEMNMRMQENPDPIYGEGFRMFKKISESPDPKALFKFMERENEKQR
ncbi:MAG: hypothetical protein JW808_01780 [Victivallales bacterium]|nr:hypothetical protein [Victivallales bacterium]